MNRIAWIDVAKGVSIILVVFYHTLMMAEAQGLQIGWIYTELNAPLRYIRMPLFFTVSAVLLGSASGMSMSAFFSKWIMPTLWVLLIWNAIYAVIGDGRFAYHELFSPYGHLWFLCALIVFRLAWVALDRVRLPAVLVAGAVSFWMLWDRDSTLGLLERNVLTYLFFFLVAAWYGRPLADWVTRNQWLAFAAGALATAISWKLAFRFGVASVGVVALWAASALTARSRMPCDLLRWLGRHSLEVFLLHFALLIPLIRVTNTVPGAAWLMPVMVTTAAILIPIGIRSLTDQVTPWLFRMPQMITRTATS